MTTRLLGLLLLLAAPASAQKAKEQAVLAGQADALLGYFMDQGPRMQLQSGAKMGWTRLYDLNGTTTLPKQFSNAGADGTYTNDTNYYFMPTVNGEPWATKPAPTRRGGSSNGS